MHHQLLNKKFSQKATVLIIYGVNILFSLASILYVLKDRKLGIIVYIILFILVILVVLKTNILIDKANKQVKKGKKK